MNNDNSDVKLALEEMRWNMQQSLSAADSLDQKANLLLVCAGLIFALITTLQISLSPNKSDAYWIVLIIATSVYIASVAITLWGANPKDYKLAIASEWETLDKNIFGRPERDAILTLLSGYVDQIQFNRRMNGKKVFAFRFSAMALLATVILLVCLSVIS